MNFLEKYNIKINNTLLLSEALTHSSYAYENNINSYEKLEFLGDAVLSVIVSEYLYNKHNLKVKLHNAIFSLIRRNFPIMLKFQYRKEVV